MCSKASYQQVICLKASLSWLRVASDTNPFASRPFLKIEEDWIESEEQKANGGSEPPESCMSKRRRIDPCSDRHPPLGLPGEVIWVRPDRNDGCDAGDENKSAHHLDCEVEAVRSDEKPEHDWVDETG